MTDIHQAVREHAFAADARAVLDLYLNHGLFSGAWFETIGGRGDAPAVADHFTAADIVAVSTLAVKIPGWATIEILDRQAGTLAGLLGCIPQDVEFHQASDEDLADSSGRRVPSLLRQVDDFFKSWQHCFARDHLDRFPALARLPLLPFRLSLLGCDGPFSLGDGRIKLVPE